jgi:energy-coupling factor transporter ATP-binding protein EcfA2
MNNKLNLSALTLKNYKNLVADGIGLNNLNVIIGPNGSGKSNFIAVLRFLKDCLISTPDKSRGITSFEEAIENLGGKRILDRTVRSPERVDFGFAFKLYDGQILFFDLTLLAIFIINESLYLSGITGTDNFYFYKALDLPFDNCEISVYNNSTQTESYIERLSDVPDNQLILSVIPELLESSKFPPERTPIYKVRRQIIDTVSGWRFYNANDMNVNGIRLSEPKIGPGDMFLEPSGENLPLVLDNLIQKDFEFEERINNAMKQILPNTRKIRPIRSGRLSLTVEWYFDSMKEPFYLDEMSDGTVRMLCWAVILHSPVPPSLLVIDEPEMGIHPSWLPVLAEWIKAASERTQIIVSTHSPDLLDHFTDRTEDVICFHFDGKSHFTPEHLSKEKLSAMFEDGWELGDLYRVGDPGVGGWPW